MRADSLNEKIAHRPTPGELVKEGILERRFGLMSVLWLFNY